MIPYSAHDVLRVMQYELTPEPARQYGSQLAADVSTDDRDDDRHSDTKGGGLLIRLIVRRQPAPSAA